MIGVALDVSAMRHHAGRDVRMRVRMNVRVNVRVRMSMGVLVHGQSRARFSVCVLGHHKVQRHEQWLDHHAERDQDPEDPLCQPAA